MKLLAMLAVAAGLALAATAPGPALAQVVITGQLNGVVVEAAPLDAPVVPVEKAEAAPAAKPALTPEVRQFVADFLPGALGPADAAAVQAKRQADLKQDEERRAAAQAQAQAQMLKARQPMIRQMTQQLRPVVLAELRLLSEIAGPDPEQRRAIAMAGGRAAREAATRMMGGRQVIVERNGRREVEQADPRKMIQAAMAEEVKARLPAEAHDRYQKDLRRRAEIEKQAVILAQVANLDRLLYLSPDQRDKLVASLRAHYETESCPPIDAVVVYDSHTPSFPDERVVPLLTGDQRAVWGQASKINLSSISFRSVNPMDGQGNAPAEDPDVAAAFAEEEPK